TSYLARLRNPNPNMPKEFNYESPLSLEEYRHRGNDPFQHHGSPSPAGAGAGHANGKGAH
ncbi:MAG TPA: hypothetical protein PLH97_09610, partial [Verrucomicrobiota bacterium]|nr:hypothetical protein [Verrucomicrobiota bacterium]